jgi:chromate transporter
VQTDTHLGLFLRFLRFGCFAWGGPVAQIAMLRRELVDDEGWVDSDHFNRALAVYQALPGPEATELSIWFGMGRRGRLGGLLAGIGFVLPGVCLILALSYMYTRVDFDEPFVQALFAGFGAAIVALIVRAVHRIGSHALTRPWLWVIAGAAAVAQVAHVHFAIPLVAAALAALAFSRGRLAVGAAVLVALVAFAAMSFGDGALELRGDQRSDGRAGVGELAISGLKTGALTFGGAYTAVPFLQEDAVVDHDWVSNDEFVDGLALTSVLPAPLVVFATFVGYQAGGLAGALVITLCVFAPAFAITLWGHRHLERVIADTRLHALLDGVTAAVVGYIAVAAAALAIAALDGVVTVGLLIAALAVLAAWKSRVAIVVTVLGCGAVGVLAQTAGVL